MKVNILLANFPKRNYFSCQATPESTGQYSS